MRCALTRDMRCVPCRCNTPKVNATPRLGPRLLPLPEPSLRSALAHAAPWGPAPRGRQRSGARRCSRGPARSPPAGCPPPHTWLFPQWTDPGSKRPAQRCRAPAHPPPHPCEERPSFPVLPPQLSCRRQCVPCPRVAGLQLGLSGLISSLLPTVSTGAARLTPEGPSRDGPPRGLVRPAPGRRVRGTGWPWLPVHKRLRNRLPLPPVRRGHGDSRTVHPGGESVRRPSSVACGPPQPARPAPARAPRERHTRGTGAFSDVCSG